MFTSIGGPEILVILLVVLVLFGADKLPEMARGLSKGMQEFRKASDNLKDEIEKTTNEFSDTYDHFRNEVEEGKNGIKDSYRSTFEEPWEVDTDWNDVDDEIEQNGEVNKDEGHKDNLS